MAEAVRRVEVTIVNPQGLHARPSAMIVKTTNRFEAQVTLTIGTKTADCKSIMDVMMLASPRGTRMVFEADGVDAERALDALATLVRAGFDES